MHYEDPEDRDHLAGLAGAPADRRAAAADRRAAAAEATGRAVKGRLLSKNRISLAAGWVAHRKHHHTDDGCRYCGKPISKGRLTFCSRTCVHEWRVRSDPGYVRECLRQRDGGVCSECGLDTVAVASEMRVIESAARGVGTPRYRYTSPSQAFERFVEENKLFWARGHRSPWEADHVLAVAEGGGECGLDGYRTLCVPCHRRVTAAMQHRLADCRGQASHTAPEVMDMLGIGPDATGAELSEEFVARLRDEW